MPTIPVEPARWARKVRWGLRVVTLLLLVGVVALLHRPLFLGNIGTVDPGRIYRSAQPKANLGSLIQRYTPGSILNLRGGSPHDDWYAAEVAAAGREGLDFYDYPMSAERRPTRGQLLTLLDLFDHADYPILIHCKQGADRTGLACALYLLSVRGLPPELADDAFTFRHGHVPLFGPERLHEPLDEYRAWLAAGRLNHTPTRFRHWVATSYHDATDSGPIEPLKPGSRWDRVETTARSATSKRPR